MDDNVSFILRKCSICEKVTEQFHLETDLMCRFCKDKTFEEVLEKLQTNTNVIQFIPEVELPYIVVELS